MDLQGRQHRPPQVLTLAWVTATVAARRRLRGASDHARSSGSHTSIPTQTAATTGGTVSHGSSVGHDAYLRLMLIGALGTWLGIHALRTYLATLLWNVSRGATTAEEVGIIGLAVFSIGLVAWVPTRLVGGTTPVWRFALLLCGLVIGRQVLPAALALPLFPFAAWIAWLWWLPAFLSELSRRGVGSSIVPAVILGVAAQVAGQTALHGLDLPLLPGRPGLVASGLLCGAFLAAVYWTLVKGRSAHASGAQSGMSARVAFVLGPYLFLQLTLLANLGRLQEVSGWHLLPVALIVGLSLAGGLACLAWVPTRPTRIVLSLLVLGLLAPGEWMTGWGLVALIPLQAALAVVLAATAAPAARSGPGRIYAATAGGWLLTFLLFFVFYAYDNTPLAWLVAMSVLGILAGLQDRPALVRDRRPVLAAGIALVVGVALSLVPPPSTNRLPAAEQLPTELRVVTYNVHQGFDVLARPSAPMLADVIAATQPDLVSLQEVHRGSNLGGGADLVAYLRWRFPEYHLLFGPTYTSIGGNVILSRYPVRDWAWAHYPRGETFLTRGYLWVEIDNAPTDLVFVATHLGSAEVSDRERAMQADVLAARWGARGGMILAGDFNAQPGDPAIERLRGAGFTDVIGDLMPTRVRVSSIDERLEERIDYIFTSPDLSPISAEVETTSASDHPLVVTTIRIRGNAR